MPKLAMQRETLCKLAPPTTIEEEDLDVVVGGTEGEPDVPSGRREGDPDMPSSG